MRVGDGWTEEVVGDVKDGLDLADRFEPASRHLRSVLAYGMLGANLHWDLDTLALEILAEAWAKLFGEN